MGEIADMMLDGDLCATCGSATGNAGDGYARYCSEECKPSDLKKKVKPEKNFGVCAKCSETAVAKLSWVVAIDDKEKSKQELAGLCKKHFDQSLKKMSKIGQETDTEDAG